MVSIQTNLSVSSGIKYSSFHSTGASKNKKAVSNYSAENEIVQFYSQIRTNTTQRLSDQNAIYYFDHLNKEDKASLVYNGRPISELSVNEAQELVSDEGYFGIGKTSQRIVDFVIKGAGENLDRLKAGREGILHGFEAAEKAWGGKLPDISYETLAKSLETIDERIQELGGSVLDLSV